MPITGKLPPGVVAVIENLSLDQPRPNGNGSSFTLLRPQDVISLTAQSPALRNPGEFVSRGPQTSVSQLRISITFDRWNPSSLIL